MVSCLVVTEQYNNHKGRADIMDKKKTTYQFNHGSKYKYYFRVVHDLIGIAINNANVVILKFQQHGKQNMDGKWYRRMIARLLIRNFTCRKRAAPKMLIFTEKISKFYKRRPDAIPHTMEKCANCQKCKLCTRRNSKTLLTTNAWNATYICVMSITTIAFKLSQLINTYRRWDGSFALF